MKIIALGDIHGRSDWMTIIDKNTFDKVIFIGDYFDTHENIPPEQQKENFKEIVSFKKSNMDKVVLLCGNHDYHYLRTTNETYSGYQQWQKTDIQELLHPAIDEGLLQMCFTYDNLLFCHAGITKTWCKNNLIQEDSIEESVNDLFKFKPTSFRFTRGKNYSPYGDDVEQSPIWVRPKSLLKDRIEGFIQVVGHTSQDKLIITDDVILIDTLGSSNEYLIYDNSKLSVGKNK